MNLTDNLSRDLRYALRGLFRDRGFTVAAVLILALGIGANTVTFSLVNAGLFRPRPYLEPDRLVTVYQYGRENAPEGTSFPAYLDMAATTDVFAGAAAVSMVSPVRFQVGDELRPALAEYATASYLAVLGLEPSHGRWFLPSEDRREAGAAAVVSHHAWRTRFGADPGLLGRTLRINSVPVTIVGIGPENLTSSLAAALVTDFWLSISTIPPQEGSTLPPRMLERDPPERAFDVKARLRDGVNVAQAQAAMDVLAARLAADHPGVDPGRGISVFPSEAVRTHPQIDVVLVPAATVVLVVTGLVLAIGCSNLATLLLVRGSSRSQELSVRLALGASRRQLLRQLLTENLLLSAAGGAAGCALALGAVRLLARLDLPLTIDLTLDMRVLAFTVVLTVLTGLAFGLAPALQSLRFDLVATLRAEDASTLGLARRWFSLKNMLVVAQVTVSVVLLTATGILVGELEKARDTDVGVDVGRLAMLETDARYAGHQGEEAQRIYEELLRRIEAIPGVESATLANGPPAGGGVRARRPPLLIAGHAASSGAVGTDESRSASGEGIAVDQIVAGPGYFETLGVSLLRGRAFEESDRAETQAVAIVNESMARLWFGTVDAVGQSFRYEAEPDVPIVIVGVVPDLRTDVMEAPEPVFYRSFRQIGSSAPTVIARASATLEASGLAQSMQTAMREMDPALPVVVSETMEKHVADSLVAIETAAAALGALSLAGLSLAAIGLNAVIAFAVARRSRELGIRMALGARAVQVVRLVAREVAKLVAAGIAAGLGVAWLVILVLQLLAADLSAAPHLEVRGPRPDALLFVVVAAVIVIAGLAAAFFPARRAAKADPLVALRHS